MVIEPTINQNGKGYEQGKPYGINIEVLNKETGFGLN